MSLPWSYTFEQGTDENNKPIFIIHVNEFPNVGTDAPTVDEAFESIAEALKLTIQMYLEKGMDIPEPINQDQFKGNIAYRTSARRHYLIAKEAKKRSLSLSQIIDSYIDSALHNKN